MKTWKGFLSVLLSLVLVLGMFSGMRLTAYADTEKSETIATTSDTVEGTHFTIISSYSGADSDGMYALDGITVTPKNTEYITKVVITCGYMPEHVFDGNTKVSSGTKTITNGGGTVTVTEVNANTFTFTCEDGVPPAQFNQFVVYYTVAVTGMTIDPATASLTVGETLTLTPTVLPDTATDKTVTWTTSDETVATVDANGVVTALAAGEATITATANDGSGVTGTCTVTVSEPTVAVTSVTVEPTELNLNVNDSATLTATVLPDTATDKTVTWTSSDETVATVDANGVVTAVARGEATITVTTFDGDFTASCTVTVLPANYTVNYAVVNGTWADDSTANKTEIVADGSKPADVPTGMKAFAGYTGGAWDRNPADATITGATTFTYTFEAIPTYTVTYKVVNGTWSDGNTTDITETVQSGSKPAAVPTGMKASEGYTGGAWDTNPADATITGATTFTYTFEAIPTYTVTYAVEGGTWADDTTANKTEIVVDGSKPAAVPTGMKALEGYTGGAWDTNPADATITGATTFTYTFEAIPTYTIIGNEFYIDGILAKGAGLVRYEGDLYFVKKDGTLFTGASLTVTEAKANGVAAPGKYWADEDGRMTAWNGIVNGRYYENGAVVRGKGLVKIDGDLYFVKKDGTIYTGASFTVTEANANGLAAPGKYWADEDGRMTVCNGIVNGYYYENGAIVRGKGLVRIDGDLYFVKKDGTLFTGASLTVTEANANGLADPGKYWADEDGRMTVRNGIVNGYYYENGAIVRGKGLVTFAGDFCFVKKDGTVFKDAWLYVTEAKANGLVSAGKYYFDADGMMILP